MKTPELDHIEIEILLKDLDYRREEIMDFTKQFNDNAKLIKTYFLLFGILLTAILLQKPFDFANQILTETDLDLNTYSIIILLAATIFLFFLITERSSLLCQIYLNGSRIKQIEKLINNNYQKDLLIWESKIIDSYYFFNFSRFKLWINPTYLLGIAYGIIILFIAIILAVLSFKVFSLNISIIYSSMTLLITLFLGYQLIEIHRTGKEYLDSLFEQTPNRMTINRETISFLKILSVLNKKATIPILTFLFGFFLFFVSSLISNSFFLDSQYDYPLLIFPTILLGDSILLPIFNYKFFNMIRNIDIKPNSKFKILFAIIVSFIASSFINIFIHSTWIHDNYTGFMDLESEELSFAGYSHLIFSILQTMIVFCFIFFSLFIFNYKTNNYKSTINTWLIFLVFSLLSIVDFFVQTWYLKIAIVDITFFDYISRFSTIIFSLAILIVLWLKRKKERNTLYNTCQSNIHCR